MYIWLLCTRYLVTRRIALVSVASVMIGVATMIVVNSVMGGFRQKMRERLHGILADLVVESRSTDGFSNPAEVMENIRALVGDKVAAMTPAVEIFGVLSYQHQGRGPHWQRGVRILGIDPAGRAAVGDFREHLLARENRAEPSFKITAAAAKWRQDNLDLIDPDIEQPPADPVLAKDHVIPAAVIGYQIATVRPHGTHTDHYIIHPGQEIVLTTVKAGRPDKTDCKLIVADLFKSEMSEYDGNYIFMPLRKLQQIRGMADAVTSIQIRLADYRDAPDVVAKLRQAFHPGYFVVETWEDKQGPLLHAVKVEAAILNIILFFIIAVAGFGILSIFFMIVVEKTRDIGILKALGASNQGVMGIFLAYGLALGLIGCGLGVLFGIAFTHNINPIEKTLTRWTGYEVFPRDVYYFQDIPTLLDPWAILWVSVGALAIAVGASVLPARRAAGLNPVEALRYE